MSGNVVVEDGGRSLFRSARSSFLVALVALSVVAIDDVSSFPTTKGSSARAPFALRDAPTADDATETPPFGGPPPPPSGATVGPPRGGGAAGGGGPPPGGGGGGGGPPPPTAAQRALEAVFEVAFGLLYLGDDSGVRDSSKNLRVLWTRALLHSLGRIEDDVASRLLPERTRWVVGTAAANAVWRNAAAVLEKLEWIVDRTAFVDAQLDAFLAETENDENDDRPRRLVLVGAGYDTRSLRYRRGRSRLTCYEIDLPDVCETKALLVDRYDRSRVVDDDDVGDVVLVPADLERRDLAARLAAAGFDVSADDDVPTMVVCEAVLFYLSPGAAERAVADLFGLRADRYCWTDNLSKVGVTPGPPVPVSPRTKCEAWLRTHDHDLVAHDSLWGGAIHFVGAVPRNKK